MISSINEKTSTDPALGSNTVEVISSTNSTLVGFSGIEFYYAEEASEANKFILVSVRRFSAIL